MRRPRLARFAAVVHVASSVGELGRLPRRKLLQGVRPGGGRRQEAPRPPVAGRRKRLIIGVEASTPTARSIICSQCLYCCWRVSRRAVVGVWVRACCYAVRFVRVMRNPEVRLTTFGIYLHFDPGPQKSKTHDEVYWTGRGSWERTRGVAGSREGENNWTDDVVQRPGEPIENKPGREPGSLRICYQNRGGFHAPRSEAEHDHLTKRASSAAQRTATKVYWDPDMRRNGPTAPWLAPQPKMREKTFDRRRTACHKKNAYLVFYTDIYSTSTYTSTLVSIPTCLNGNIPGTTYRKSNCRYILHNNNINTLPPYPFSVLSCRATTRWLSAERWLS